jgi:hypothetical protein
MEENCGGGQGLNRAVEPRREPIIFYLIVLQFISRRFSVSQTQRRMKGR